MYISEFDRQQLKRQIVGIKDDMKKDGYANSSITTTLRAMAFTLSDKDRIPACEKCGTDLAVWCSVCDLEYPKE